MGVAWGVGKRRGGGCGPNRRAGSNQEALAEAMHGGAAERDQALKQADRHGWFPSADSTLHCQERRYKGSD